MRITCAGLLLVIVMHSSAQGAIGHQGLRQCGSHFLGLQSRSLTIDSQRYRESGIFDKTSGEYLYLDESGRHGVMLYEPDDPARSYIYFVAEQNRRMRPAGERLTCHPIS